MLRGLVEAVAKVDALDMSWVRFRRTASALNFIHRQQQHKPRPEDEAEYEHFEGKESLPW